jgi:membrane protease YdiL (CAAX protease family)
MQAADLQPVPSESPLPGTVMSAAPGETGPVSGGRTRFKAKLGWAFLGPDGIRAGWSILIFMLIVSVLIVVATLAGRLATHNAPEIPKGAFPPRFFLIKEAIGLVMVLAATAIMGWIEGKPVWAYGLAGPRKVQNFLAGLIGGVVFLSVLVGVLAAGGYLVFDGTALHGLQIVKYALIWLLAFLLVGCGEEAFFRGYLQSTLARGIGFWPAALVTSLLFAAAHVMNPGESADGITGVFVAGLVFCLLLRLSGSLWLGIGFHTTWDWAQSYLYGSPDSGIMFQNHLLMSHAAGNMRMSGGSAGPEGSILGAPVMVVGLLVLAWILQRAGLFAVRRKPSETNVLF